MKCFYCNREAKGMKATTYFSTNATSFRFLCKVHWENIKALYDNEKRVKEYEK